MTPSERVLGWDLLRGLCAVAVACYHLLLWQDVAALHSFGSYGVYMFFVLSGASLAYTYGPRIAAHDFSFGDFLPQRSSQVSAEDVEQPDQRQRVARYLW